MSDPLLPEITGHLLAAMDGDIAPSSLRSLAARLVDQVRTDERARITAGVLAIYGPGATGKPDTPAPKLPAVLAAIEGRLVNDAPTKAPPGCAHCGHSRSRHYLKGDRCAANGCYCLYPSRAAVIEGEATP